MKNNIIILTLVGIIGLMAVITVYSLTSKTEKAPKVARITTSSTTREINKFFSNASVEVVSNQVVWSLNKTDLLEETAYAAARADTKVEKIGFRKYFLSQGGIIYRQVCYNLHAFDEAWSLGYCVHKNVEKGK